VIKDLLLLFFLLLGSLWAFNQTAQANVKDDLYKIAKKNHRPEHYSRAKSYLFGMIHLQINDAGYFVEDVYCNRKYDKKSGVGKMKEPNANIINTEHTWPQSKFTNCDRRAQKSDLHHLYPSQNKANSHRSNLIFGEVDGHEIDHKCQDSLIGTIYGTGIKAFEPPDRHKGNVARALFYFSVRYKARILDVEEKYLRVWNELDPPDEHEKLRNDLIEKFQGNRNPFIDNPAIARTIKDF
jgi:endonuclease I